MSFRFYRPLFLTVAIFGMLLALSLQMKSGRHPAAVSFFFWDYWLDTVKHLAGFVLIGFTYFAGVYRRGGVTFARYLGIVWPVALFAAFSEVLQLGIPTRSCNFHDLMANILGSLAGYVVVLAFIKRASRIETDPSD